MGLIYECCKNCPKRGNVCVCDAPTFSRLVEDTSSTLETKCPDCEKKDKEIKELKKALELAVLEGHSKRTFKKRYYRFINQAKEQLKDEGN